MILFLFINNTISEELFKNNHNVHNDDTTFKDFLAWRFKGDRPDRVSIEISDEFNNAKSLPEN